MIGILASDNIADLKPLGDRLLVEVCGPELETLCSRVKELSWAA